MMDWLAMLKTSKSETPGFDDLVIQINNRDGYKRENAVRRLGKLGDVRALPYLIVRANDWVRQVRFAALDAIGDLMLPENASIFAACLGQLYHLANCGRDNHDKLIQRVTDFLLQPGSREYLVNATNAEDVRSSRIAMRLCITHQLLDSEQIVMRCLTHSDVVIKSQCISFIRKLQGEALYVALMLAKRDRYMPLRREAFLLCLAHMVEKREELLDEMLMDRSVSIREIARWRIGDGVQPFAERLAQRLDDQSCSARTKATVLVSLAELRHHDIVPRLPTYANDEFALLRRAALYALVLLDPANAKMPLLCATLGEMPGVAKAAGRLLVKVKDDIGFADIEQCIVSSAYSHTLHACLIFAQHMGKWDYLRVILLSLDRAHTLCGKETLSHQSRSHLHRWGVNFNRSFSQPTKEQIIWLQNQASVLRVLPESHFLTDLRFTLKTYGI